MGKHKKERAFEYIRVDEFDWLVAELTGANMILSQDKTKEVDDFLRKHFVLNEQPDDKYRINFYKIDGIVFTTFLSNNPGHQSGVLIFKMLIPSRYPDREYYSFEEAFNEFSKENQKKFAFALDLFSGLDGRL